MREPVDNSFLLLDMIPRLGKNNILGAVVLRKLEGNGVWYNDSTETDFEGMASGERACKMTITFSFSYF